MIRRKPFPLPPELELPTIEWAGWTATPAQTAPRWAKVLRLWRVSGPLDRLSITTSKHASNWLILRLKLGRKSVGHVSAQRGIGNTRGTWVVVQSHLAEELRGRGLGSLLYLATRAAIEAYTFEEVQLLSTADWIGSGTSSDAQRVWERLRGAGRLNRVDDCRIALGAHKLEGGEAPEGGYLVSAHCGGRHVGTVAVTVSPLEDSELRPAGEDEWSCRANLRRQRAAGLKTDSVARIEWAKVERDFRGRGLGSKLYTAARATAADLGVPLLPDVCFAGGSTSGAAWAQWRKLGWQAQAGHANQRPWPQRWYHLTDNPRFTLDPNYAPEDNSLSIRSRGGVPGVYLAPDVEPWLNGHGYWRPFVAEFQVEDAVKADPGVHGRWGRELFVPTSSFGRIEVLRVIPLDAYAREVFAEHGWIEGRLGREFDTGKRIPDRSGRPAPFPDYRYPGPDVRQMPLRKARKLERDLRKAIPARGRANRSAVRDDEWNAGYCSVMAVALHRQTGWPIWALLDYAPEQPSARIGDTHHPHGLPFLSHAFVRTPRGTALDAEGETPWAEVQAAAGSYRRGEIRLEPLDVPLLVDIHGPSCDPESPELLAAAEDFLRRTQLLRRWPGGRAAIRDGHSRRTGVSPHTGTLQWVRRACTGVGAVSCSCRRRPSALCR